MADSAKTGSTPNDEEPGAGAEESVEDWARRVTRFIGKAAVRAREEAEDIFAEAQSIRRGERD